VRDPARRLNRSEFMMPPPSDPERDDPADEFQGDMHAADIVSPTGEEMPIATHAEVHRTPELRALEARAHRSDSRE
jgi:hypothetical protein